MIYLFQHFELQKIPIVLSIQPMSLQPISQDHFHTLRTEQIEGFPLDAVKSIATSKEISKFASM
jgi:hypothetical protein